MLRGALAVACPALECGEFLYEEGEGLEEDEVAMYASLLPRTLAALPGGGVRGGSMVGITDQLQNLNVRLILQHKVRRTGWFDATHLLTTFRRTLTRSNTPRGLCCRAQHRRPQRQHPCRIRWRQRPHIRTWKRWLRRMMLWW